MTLTPEQYPDHGQEDDIPTYDNIDALREALKAKFPELAEEGREEELETNVAYVLGELTLHIIDHSEIPVLSYTQEGRIDLEQFDHATFLNSLESKK